MIETPPSVESVEGWMPCSDRSLQRDDPLAGTAGFGERWFLVEVDGAWGTHAFFQSRMDRGLARRLVARVEGEAIRPLAIRRTALRADERRAQRTWSWAYVDARPGHESVRWGSVTDPVELLEVPLDGSAGEQSLEPVICVCTHARHDQCCAVKGRPVVTALAGRYPQQTWECSHLGGDRFAATMILFPHGLLYGRVGVEDAAALVTDYEAGIVNPALLRGRASLPNVVQAAEAVARERTGDLRLDAFRLLSHGLLSSERSGDWTVEFDHRGSRLTVELEETLSDPLLSTCSSSRALPVRQFVRRGLNRRP
jgi:hypothetical protein